MLTRIVRMEFQPARVEDFLAHFHGIRKAIRHFPGVRRLELHRDAGQPNVFYTFSVWENESDLENYRRSELFESAWSQAKQWFAASPRAYSLLREMVVDPEQ